MRFWTSPGRTAQWWINLFTGIMPAEEWLVNLRMDFSINFMKLVDMLRNYVSLDPEAPRADTITAEKRVPMVLYYLKDQGSLRMVANTFGVSKATISVSLRIVCNVLVDNLGPTLIKFPSTVEEIKASVRSIENKFQIPCVIACVDGTRIPIKIPSENHHDYFCYKMKYSLNC